MGLLLLLCVLRKPPPRLLILSWLMLLLLLLLPCYVHLSLHTGLRAPTLYSARALRARCQSGRSRKHDVGHVGGDVTGGAIEGWRYCGSNQCVSIWHRRFGSAINRLRSALFGVSLALSSTFGLVRTCVECGLSHTRDCDPILMHPKRAGGHQCNESVGGPPASSEYTPSVLVPCCGWRFGTCRTRLLGYVKR